MQVAVIRMFEFQIMARLDDGVEPLREVQVNSFRHAD